MLLGPARCAHCDVILPRQDLRDGWFENCGKQVPPAIRSAFLGPVLSQDRPQQEPTRKEREEEGIRQSSIECHVCRKHPASGRSSFPMTCHMAVMGAVWDCFSPGKEYNPTELFTPELPACTWCRWRARGWRVYSIVATLGIAALALVAMFVILASSRMGRLWAGLIVVVIALLLSIGVAWSVNALANVLFRNSLRKGQKAG